MKFYLEITLLPGQDIGIHFLWSKVFQQVHLAMAEMKDQNNKVPVGISFPKYDLREKRTSLGDKLRLFAESEESLKTLDLQQWLKRFKDYLHMTQVRRVPQKTKGMVRFRRLQPKLNLERLARRRARRKGLSEEEALSQLSSQKSPSFWAPFISMKSLSSGQRFCLFIGKESLDDDGAQTEVTLQADQEFSCYGLSADSVVPDF